MNLTSRSLIALCGLAPFALLGLAGAGQSQPSSGARKPHVPYAKVSSLIEKKCESCHNAQSHPEAIDLSSYKALMKSGEHGPIVIAGHPETSKLIKYVDGTKQPRMPYHQTPLSSSEIKKLREWISAGAEG
jgi:uncharacterized membrane protein